MKNLINNKRERDAKGVVITLGKTNEGFIYIGDSLMERSKIKIPLDELTGRENFISNSLGGSAEILESKKEKSEKRSAKFESIKSFTDEVKLDNVSATGNNLVSANENLNVNPIILEEPPLLAKLAEKNYRQPIILPSCAQWFKFEEINEIEIKVLPEFFCGKYPSKTPEIYKEYRNFIINLYRENTNSYLSATTCRRHLSGDACGIMRIHAFLEHWGLINFNIDPNSKPTNPLLPKVFNYKSPIYVDASSLLVKDGIPNFGNKIGDNSVILTNKQGDEIKTFYPINTTPEMLFRSIFNKNSLGSLNQMNFLAKNYRPKCDMCSNLCGIDWYMQLTAELANINKEEDTLHQVRDSLLLCETCFYSKNFPRGLSKEDFEMANFFNIVNPSEKFNGSLNERLENEKWNVEDTMLLIDALEKYNENWEDVVKVFNGRKTKQDCLLHLIQLPIKDNIMFKLSDCTKPSLHVTKETELTNPNKFRELSAVNDQNNPVISQVVFFSKMFEKFVSEDSKKSPSEIQKILTKDTEESNIASFEKDFTNVDNLKEVIYKTYSKSIDRSKELKSKEKKSMEGIMNLLVYLQMKKIEMKLNYFNEFEKLIQFETQQMKSMESQVIQDRIKLAIKKSELMSLSNKVKDAIKRESEASVNDASHINLSSSLNKANVDEPRILDLNHP